MPDIRVLEDAVRALAPNDLAEFRRWFHEFDAAAWDRQIEEDVATGKLETLLAEAEQDYRSGNSRPL